MSWWNLYCDRFDRFLDRSALARQNYLRYTKLRCLLCSKEVSGKANRGNIARHWEKPGCEHIKMAREADAAVARGNIIEQMHAAAALDNPAAAAAVEASAVRIRDLRANARAALALTGSLYAPRTNVGKFYEGALLETAQMLLKQTGNVLGTSPGDALDRGTVLLERKQVERLRGVYVAVLTDEATSHIGGLGRVFGITLMTKDGSMLVDAVTDLDQVGSEEPPPVAAAAAAPAEPLDADADLSAAEKEIAAAIRALPGNPKLYLRAAITVRRRLLALGIDLATQLTAVVGDNHPFNPALAAALGVPFLRCLPHVLALVFNGMTAHFKQYVAGVLGLSALLKAGGGKHRRKAFQEAGLDPAKFFCLVTRWNQLYDAGCCLLTVVGGSLVLDIVRELLMTHKAFASRKPKAPAAAAAAAALEAGEAGSDIDEDVEVQVGKAKQAVGSLLANVKGIFGADDKPCTHRFEFELRMIKDMAAGMPALISLAGADPDRLVPDLKERFTSWRTDLADFSGDGLQGLAIDKVLGEMRSAPLSETTKAILHKTAAAVKAAATDASAIYDKYAPDAFQKLRYRLRFDPQRKPEPFVVAQGKQIDDAVAKDFFGCVQATAAHVRDWTRYVNEWSALDNVFDDDAAMPKVPIKTIGINKFWRHTKIVSLFNGRDLIPNLGLWYGTYPTSNVASERNFGRMRALEGPQRHSLTAESLREELLSKCNPELCKEMLADALAALKAK